MTEIDSNVSLKGATRAQRVTLHAKNLGSFVRAGVSAQPSNKPKPSTNFRARIALQREDNGYQLPLCLDPLFRRFKGDSKAARIKDTRKRAGPRKAPLDHEAKRLKAAKPPRGVVVPA